MYINTSLKFKYMEGELCYRTKDSFVTDDQDPFLFVDWPQVLSDCVVPQKATPVSRLTEFA